MGEFKKGREQVEEELKDMQDGEKADSTLDDEDDDLDELETETDKETSA
jgi:sec-independent protein translocase protein TatA